MKRPATTSSVIDKAICVVASVVRESSRGLAARRLPGLTLETGDQIGRVLCSAGKRPKRKPVASVTDAATGRIDQLSSELDRPLHSLAAAFASARRASSGQRGYRQVHRRTASKQRLRQQLHDQVRDGLRRIDRRMAISAGSRRRSGQQEVGDVCARNQKHEHGDAEQERQAAARHRDRVGLSVCAILERDLALPETRQVSDRSSPPEAALRYRSRSRDTGR